MSRSKKAATAPTVKSSQVQEVRTDIQPQLCDTFYSPKFKWTKPWIVEPKFDGLRCWIVVNDDGKATPYSRNGKPLWNMEVILEEVEEAGFSDYILDGEVYTTDWNLTMGIVKRSVQSHPDKDKLHYHVWDCLYGHELRTEWIDKRKKKHTGVSHVSNDTRKEERLWPWRNTSGHIEVVPSCYVSNAEELNIAYLDFLKQGYEGAVLKDPAAGYYCSFPGFRSPAWLKIKPWTDADLTVVGSYPGEGKHVGRIGGLIVEGSAEWKGKSYQVHTDVGTGFTDEERETFQRMDEMGTLAGRVVEIKFQSIAEDTGACRFPIYNRLRSDK